MEKPNSALEKKIQSELDGLKSTQKEYEKLVHQRQLLDGQLNENKNVLDELNLLNDSNNVFKLFGPILIKQTLEESKQNVSKRVDYINAELNRCQKTLGELDKKQEQHRDLKLLKKIPIFIHENHNEVLESIYRSIGSKHLPFGKNFMIHFDSHPDLCRPEHMPACFVHEKQLLFDAINIESWIIPAVYGGQIERVVWVKPPWAPQIPSGKHKIVVGEYDKEIFVNSKLDYFISEGSYRSLEDLKNQKTLTLDVLELEEKPKFEELCKDAYVLDIDLDFFSTKNPFLDLYSKANAYELLKDIYILPKTYNIDDDQSILEYSKKRFEHLQALETIFQQLDDGKTYEKINGIKNSKIENLVQTLLKNYEPSEIDWQLVHNAGCTCDDIELPHHVSERKETFDLLLKFENFLKELGGSPTIITISRSSSDDYCPRDQVDFIQTQVLEILEKLYKDVDVKFEYLNEDDD